MSSSSEPETPVPVSHRLRLPWGAIESQAFPVSAGVGEAALRAWGLSSATSCETKRPQREGRTATVKGPAGHPGRALTVGLCPAWKARVSHSVYTEECLGSVWEGETGRVGKLQPSCSCVPRPDAQQVLR